MQLPAPYRDAAPIYRAAGWSGVLPIPYGTKKLLKKGWTGHNGAWPSGADIQEWIEDDSLDAGRGNIALRLPPDVIGVDVDAYAGKNGAASFTARLQEWGPLPPTWISTARDDGVSGIRLFRVPDGLRWPGQVGEHIEIIQVGHRYLVVSPSLNPDSGTRYRWIRPDGIVSTTPPGPDDLPELPDPWILGLSGGELAEDAIHADLGTAEVQAWIVGHHRPGMCRATVAVLGKLLGEMRAGSAHEALRRTFGLARLAEQGHAGLADALAQVRAAFHAEATRPGRRGTTRTPEDAEAEFRRSLAGAVRRVVGSPSVGPGEDPVDPCVDPFAALIDPAHITTSSQLAAPPAPLLQPALAPQVLGSAGSNPAPDVFGAPGDTWRPRDLALAFDGKQELPTLLRYGNERALFYAGKVNGLLGESESGKSWLALLAIAQEIQAGRNVGYVDFEDTDRTLVRRLVTLGCTREQIIDHVAYIGPEESLTAPAAQILDGVMLERAPTLVVLDGVNAAMVRLGLESNSTNDATTFTQTLLARLIATGAGVVTIDHVPKNKETRGKGGVGSQAKRAMTRGALIAAEIVMPLGKGKKGRIRLNVDKDTPGGIEYVGQSRYVGTAEVISTVAPDRVRIAITPPDERPYEERVSTDLTGLMMKISQHIVRSPGGLSQNSIEKEIGGNRDRVREALRALVEAKCVEQQPRSGRGGGFQFVHVAHYRPDPDDLVEGGDEA